MRHGAPRRAPSIAGGHAEILAHVRRGELVESIHHGHALVTRTTTTGPALGDAVVRAGDDIEFYPRSAAKPLQALAMLRSGVDLTDEQLALACASHAGLDAHQRVAVRTLASANLSETDLQNTPDRPLDAAAGRAAAEPTSLAQNCSGKHAAMLATCRHAGWDTRDYLHPDHPLQRQIMATFAELTGVEPRIGVDGCGAPTPTTTLSGMSRALRGLLTAAEGSHERRIVTVMRRHPALISGPGRLDTRAMEDVDGLLVKGGAEGVLVAALPELTIVVKIADGNPRALPVLLADALRLAGRAPAGARAWDWEGVPVLGHGRPVGEVVSLLERAGA